MTPIIFRDECFDVEIHLLTPTTAWGLQAYIKRVTGEDYDPGEYRGIAFYCEKVAIIALEDPWTDSIRDHATLAHECLHTAFNCLHGNDIVVTRDMEEVCVLFFESIFRRCLIFLQERATIDQPASPPLLGPVDGAPF